MVLLLYLSSTLDKSKLGFNIFNILVFREKYLKLAGNLITSCQIPRKKLRDFAYKLLLGIVHVSINIFFTKKELIFSSRLN